MAHAFNADTTAEEASAGIDLSGKTVVLTGGSAGLGVEAARVLALRGARIVSVVRDEAKGKAAAESIRERVPGAEIELALLDLFDLDSDPLERNDRSDDAELAEVKERLLTEALAWWRETGGGDLALP